MKELKGKEAGPLFHTATLDKEVKQFSSQDGLDTRPVIENALEVRNNMDAWPQKLRIKDKLIWLWSEYYQQQG